MINYQADQVFKNENDTTGYWRVTASFQARRGYGGTTPDKAWYKRVRNEGFYIKDGSRVVRAVDDNKSPRTKPVLLKADGTEETDPDAAHFLFFQVYGQMPYNSLGFL
jgi:hypothetical protein